MANSYTEVTNQGWFSRLGGAIKGIFIGLILFLVAFPLLFWNEGRSVNRIKTLNEGKGEVVSLASPSVEASHEGKLVHLTGKADTKEQLTDAAFGVTVNAIRLARDVEMYQWQENSKTEEKKKVGGGVEKKTTYTYEKVWSSSVIDSGSFKEASDHQNHGSMPYQSETWQAKNVTVGGFTLSEGLVGMINQTSAHTVSALPQNMAQNAASADQAARTGMTAGAPAEASQTYGQSGSAYGGSTYGGSSNQGYGSAAGSYGSATYDASSANQGQSSAPQTNTHQGRMQLHDGGYYIGASPASPQIGDVRVRFKTVLPCDVSIVAKQTGNMLTPYPAKTGGTILLLQTGIHTAEMMFQAAEKANKMLTWILRLVGFLLMMIGLASILKPISVVADVIPFVGNVIGTGIGLVSALLALGFSTLTIAIAWIVYRPLLGILLLVVAIGAFIAVRSMGSKKAPAPPA